MFAVRPALWLAGLLGFAVSLRAADQPTWGQAWSRNLVSAETGLPDTFDPKARLNLRWSVPLGTETYATPVVAGGRIYIGTNNDEPRDPRHQGDRGVLLCLDERDGRLIWQLVVPKRIEDIYFDWPKSGMSSPATVEGDRVYLVDNRGVVLCLDREGLANGNDGPFLNEGVYYAPQPTNDLARGAPVAFRPDGTLIPDAPAPNRVEPGPIDADILWMFDLSSGAGIWSHDAAHSGIIIHGNHLYLNTGNGVDNTHRRVRRPEAPGLVVLDKRTGRMVARERSSVGERIFHSTWSPPSLAPAGETSLVFFVGGDAVVRAFEPLAAEASPEVPATLRQVWEHDFDPTGPKTNVARYMQNRRESPSNVYGMPVVVGDRVYVAGGGDYWWGKNEAWLKCFDTTGRGDVTARGPVWSYPLRKHVFATPAVHDGLAYIGDCEGVLHCVDARTGEPVWQHEASGDFWGSTLVADGKVYGGTRRGQFVVLAAGREKRVLATIELGSPLNSTPVAANGVLYVATMNRLLAIATPGAASEGN